jgi:cation diffusion facilitator CzcD-associated flavoprotein CzcO
MTNTIAELKHVDVLIVGAGIAGIGMACHLTTKQPGRTFAIVDSRDAIGGTWDLFRYPGVRSDSDMQTFGFEFKPWTQANAIADADEILDYLQEAITEHDLWQRIQLGHKVVRIDFSSADAQWTVTLERVHDGKQFILTCGFLFCATGYYDYSAGYTPHFEGREQFTGTIVHPQDWPADLDYVDKEVVVIGSGATAVTLVPAMAESAAHVTMLQRSPSYVLSLPRVDPIVSVLRLLLPEKVAYRVARRINIKRLRLLYVVSQRYPALMRRVLRSLSARALPPGYAIDTHFNPSYNPWDERMCLIPDHDLFKAVSDGKATVVTDHIVRFTERGILLQSGAELDADIIVTATGLQLMPFGGIELHVDGQHVAVEDRLAYKGMMLSGVPNFAFAIGYVNASWTLKVDLACEHLCRIFAHMDRSGYSTVVPVLDDPGIDRELFFDFSPGYMKRRQHLFPRRGSRGPWTVEQNYAVDRARLRNGPIEDPALQFTPRSVRLLDPTAFPRVRA